MNGSISNLIALLLRNTPSPEQSNQSFDKAFPKQTDFAMAVPASGFRNNKMGFDLYSKGIDNSHLFGGSELGKSPLELVKLLKNAAETGRLSFVMSQLGRTVGQLPRLLSQEVLTGLGTAARNPYEQLVLDLLKDTGYYKGLAKQTEQNKGD